MKSKVEIQVWHRSESKKKSKKRNLVGIARHSLEDLLVRQERDKSALRMPTLTSSCAYIAYRS